MVKKILSFLGKETAGLHQAAYLLGFFTLLGQVLALVRDRLFASSFGAGSTLDLYYASFRIPDLIFVTISSLVSVTVLIPALSRLSNKEEERKFISSIYTVFFLVMILVIGVVYIFIPELVEVVVPGIHDPMLITMTRILLLSPLILGLSNLCGGVVQAERRFMSYALAPVFYNIGIIAGLVWAYPVFGVVGLVYGVIFGSLLHLAIQLPAMRHLQMVPNFTKNIDWKHMREVFAVSIPRTLTLASGNILNVVLVALGSLMTVGSISVFTFAFNMQSVPMSIIGVSYSLAAFPTLSRLWSEKNTKGFYGELSSAAKHILFWSIPVIILFVVLRAQIVRTIYGAGSFDWNATRLTAAVLAIFAVSLVAQNIALLCIRAWYAMGNTKKPFMYALIGDAVSLFFLGVGIYVYIEMPFFYSFFETLFKVSGIAGTEVLILPVAFSVGSIVEAILLWKSLPYTDFRHAFNIGKSIFQSFGASVIMGYVAYLMLGVLDDILNVNTLVGIFSQGLIAGIVGIVAGVCVLMLMNNNEVWVVWKTLHSKLWKAKPVVAENPTELI